MADKQIAGAARSSAAWKGAPTLEARRSSVEHAVMEMLPEANPEKAGLSAAIIEAAALLERDESIQRLYQYRIAPTRIRGAGLVLVTDRALIAVDSHPPDAARCYRLPINELRSITVAPVSGGRFTGVAVLSEHGAVEFFIGQRPHAEKLVGELHQFAPDAVDADPAAVVANWWQDPRIAWPRTLALGTKWEYIGGPPGLHRRTAGLSMHLSRSGIVAAKSGAAGHFRIDLPWHRVRTVRVECARHVRPRMEAKRRRAAGLRAVPARRRMSPGFLVVDLNDGGEVVFASRYPGPVLRNTLSSILAAAPLVEAQ
jgi:hypothetical protein